MKMRNEKMYYMKNDFLEKYETIRNVIFNFMKIECMENHETM